MPDRLNYQERLAGVLLGTAVGDALGLPAEGLGPQVIASRWEGQWRHRFFCGRGMISDDTEHTAMVAQCLLEHPTDADAFQRALAKKLRWWLLALPAGVGVATAKAIVKLWMGFSPKRSGVASAGNGPAMRSAVMGVFFAHDEVRRRQFVEASARLTHTDTRAIVAARAVAEIAAFACSQADGSPNALLLGLSPEPDWQRIVTEMCDARSSDMSVCDFAIRLGLGKGVSGYAYHSVPIAIYAWWRHRRDFQAALESAMNCGGDTDTVGAITGALAGADLGVRGIPEHLVRGVSDWPRSISWLRVLAERLDRQLSQTEPLGALSLFWPALPLRNLGFLLIVLVHGLGRLIPRAR
ncbi:MAG: ADP-ribosylglycohydrolase [Rariglobus sp.]|jgi:ADP-ribosylglycohydrolase|nr:ADP-ribosylglycohydrolase [Rariglobus sp.]